MIIVKLSGGLGNQMFQYAFGRYLSELLDTELKLYIDEIYENGKATKRIYGLGAFNIKENFVTDKELKLLRIKTNSFRNKIQRWTLKKIKFLNTSYVIEKSFEFNQLKFKSGKDYFLEGYWQSEKYFKSIENIIKEEFQLKYHNEEIIELIGKIKLQEESVSIHIRRGDYVTNPITAKYHGVCDSSYYKKAISIFENKIKNPYFYVFSDDIDWAKKNLPVEINAAYISELNFKDYVELQLMSLCKHNIIANSSFSWWGAWLNSNMNKIVIAPNKWFNTSINTIDLIPSTWNRI